jgi:hypothetical protein
LIADAGFPVSAFLFVGFDMRTSDEMIEAMVVAINPGDDQEHGRHITREALRSIVRLAQAEQRVAMLDKARTMAETPTVRH